MRLAALLCILAVPIFAQDHEPAGGTDHSLFHHFYQYWHNRQGTHCCDETHCRPLDPEHARFNAETQKWEVWLEGQWREIADSRYVRDDGGLGPFPTLCHEGAYIFCFDPPDPLM